MSDEKLNNEIQRRVAAITVEKNREISELKDIIADCTDKLIQQGEILFRLTVQPVIYAKVLDVINHPDPAAFAPNDEVVVTTDKVGPKSGKIISGLNNTPVVDENGCVTVALTDNTEGVFGIGLQGKVPAEVRLAQKYDGTLAVLAVDGKAWEVKNIPLDIQVGDVVKIRPDNKAVVEKTTKTYPSGNVCRVMSITDKGIEVLHKGDVAYVLNPQAFALEEGDRVLCDPEMFTIIEKLPKDNHHRYKVTSELNVDWDSIGGLGDAKQELQNTLELPYQHPDLFRFYNVEELRGFLIYGPPGCGKTMIARAAYTSTVKRIGLKAATNGFMYIKGSEILDKWVGNTEAEVRSIFERARRFFREHGHKSWLVIDEADAIMPQRGTRRSSDIADTLVPMFLAEMDGLDSKQTTENPIVVLLTNRVDILDPAITRPGRISKHIKINRPTDETALDILDIYTKNIPFKSDRDTTLATAASDLFSKSKLLYNVNGYSFCLADAVNGSMIASLVESAKMVALHRDIKNKTQTGLMVDDFRKAIHKIYEEQQGLNHSYDIEDFCSKHQIQYHSAKVERSFGSS